MTTNTITVAFGPRHRHVAVSACSEPVGMPRVRRPWRGDVTQPALVADKSIYKSTRVSVPGCRGAT